MRLRRMVAAAMAVTMIISSTVPAFAAVTNKKTVGDSTLIYTDNAKNINYPNWIWINGNCYYYQNAVTVLKNTTTPDGYTVDDQGRWTVNGAIQTNGYGNYTMGTSDYNGKSNDEIWNSLVKKLEPVFNAGIPVWNTTGNNTLISPKEISYDIASGGVTGNDITILKNNDYYGTFITARIGNNWSDQVQTVIGVVSKKAYANTADIKEKTIKAIVGDTVGKELFDYIRAYADKLDTTGGYVLAADEKGNPIKGRETIDPSTITAEMPFGDPNAPSVWIDDPNGPDYKSVWVKTVGNGIRPEGLDLSMWQNRKTDYGKRFSAVIDNGAICIHVNN